MREGDKVEADYPGQVIRQILPGKVTRIHGDGSILTTTGQRPKLEAVTREGVGLRERSEPVPFPQSVAGPHARRHARGGALGTRVGIHFPLFTGIVGRSKKYPGKISRVHADGTF